MRPGEMGSVDAIREHAARFGVEVHQVDLGTQSRYGDGEEYVPWVQRLLGLAPASCAVVPPWEAAPSFEVRLVSSPEEMEAFLAAKLEGGYSAR